MESPITIADVGEKDVIFIWLPLELKYSPRENLLMAMEVSERQVKEKFPNNTIVVVLPGMTYEFLKECCDGCREKIVSANERYIGDLKTEVGK